MQKYLYKLSGLIDFIPLRYLKKLTGQPFIFPFYHAVSDRNIIHIKHLYSIRNTKEFQRDLDFLLKEYDPVDPKELITNYKTGVVPKKPGFLLTFDDGLSEFYSIIAPILKKKGIPAICFLNSGFIDNKALFFRYKVSILKEKLIKSALSPAVKKELAGCLSEHKIPYDDRYDFLYSVNYLNRQSLDEMAAILEVDFQDYLDKNKPYLRTDEIEELISQGFLFGAHSIDHPKYSDLPFEQQVFQTEQSIYEITRNFLLDYKLFSFPFTDFGLSKSLFDILFAGDRRIADLSFGCAGLKKDECLYNIQRIPLEVENFSAREIIYGEYLYYFAKSLLKRNMIRRV
jgi:peptidoglycan/xylan/chitin deacetylase (PgdA/CDA1 family)